MKFEYFTNPALTNMQQYLKIIERLNRKILELERILEELKAKYEGSDDSNG